MGFIGQLKRELRELEGAFNTGYTLGKLSPSDALKKVIDENFEKDPDNHYYLGLKRGYSRAEREHAISKDHRMNDLENIQKNKSKNKDLDRTK